jgi:hypothetical protein
MNRQYHLVLAGFGTVESRFSSVEPDTEASLQAYEAALPTFNVHWKLVFDTCVAQYACSDASVSDLTLPNLASMRWYCLFIATIWDFVHQNTFSGCRDMILNTPVCMFSALSFFAWFYQKIHISKNIPQAYKVFAIKPKPSYLSNHWMDFDEQTLRL